MGGEMVVTQGQDTCPAEREQARRPAVAERAEWSSGGAENDIRRPLGVGGRRRNGFEPSRFGNAVSEATS